ncbi:hypothetical protein O181_074794 [Austropuccinia psidii MF-1]|uniref:Glycosyl transferase family 28 C-terminal domain-containing protein n=1 Tax=Austropuccinia psidii MF-1 TaxID=1389203 RepID=A0A9Q3F997_9BASI|nr:hypothetical protein [Austropuccinia psidii MF-1]
MKTFKFAYYCSGHGFGHATRVTPITLSLLSLHHQVWIISSAPKSVFDSSIQLNSKNLNYRQANLEPNFIQPKAYEVDKIATLNNLEKFIIHHRNSLIQSEKLWLIDNGFDGVLCDAPFLPCAAANQANLPSIIISNFTFDSCYSYLQQDSLNQTNQNQINLTTLDHQKLQNLINITIKDYACANALFRLPGSIPIPAFDNQIELPATKWIDLEKKSFTSTIEKKLLQKSNQKKLVIDVPLVVRPISHSAYHPNKKLELLNALGVPSDLINSNTKILLVSFGGHHIPSPQSILHPSNTLIPTHSLLPSGWIAIICGLSAENMASWSPYHFYSVSGSEFDYIPDLTAIVDVVLGKLGYGTCSEVLTTMTPFIYVPRSMFVEEYGLKRLMLKHLTTLEMSRKDFENGSWKDYIESAYQLGKNFKLQHIQQQLSEKLKMTHIQDGEMKQKINSASDIVANHLQDFMDSHQANKNSQDSIN